MPELVQPFITRGAVTGGSSADAASFSQICNLCFVQILLFPVLFFRTRCLNTDGQYSSLLSSGTDLESSSDCAAN
ncbi:hypothetical protein HHUSO_G37008 [Huso huso]|uniref:Uncharacterized protein n=1 Tax=Huso huso TaxID=61971 RepID=A0ABR0Y0J4_HUSHU